MQSTVFKIDTQKYIHSPDKLRTNLDFLNVLEPEARKLELTPAGWTRYLRGSRHMPGSILPTWIKNPHL